MGLGAGTLWLMAPDAGPPVAVPVPPLAVPVAPLAVPDKATDARPTPTNRPPSPGRASRPWTPPRPATFPIDRRTPQTPDITGISTAAGLRTPDLLRCWNDWTQQYGEPGGRFAIALTVADGRVAARYPAGGPSVAPLETCLDDAFADAVFEAVDGADAIHVTWHVPTPLTPPPSPY